MNVKELAAISSTLGPVIRDVITREIDARMKAFTPVAGPKGDPGDRGEVGAAGDPGPEGPAGKDAVVDLDAIALKAAELIRVPNDGKDGRDGADAVVDLDALALKAAELLPTPKDGRDGKDADPDAIIAAVLEKAMPLLQKSFETAISERLTTAVNDAMTKALALLPTPKDGRDGLGVEAALVTESGDLVLTMTNGATKSAGKVVGEKGRDGLPGLRGEKGEDGQDGADALGFDDMAVNFDGERTIAITAKRGDRSKTIGTFSLPVEIYRGVFQDGKSYERGDGVTWAGSEWHCNEVTTSKPGDGSKAWTLKVKRGRDGRDGKDAGTVAAGLPVVKLR